MYTQQRICGRYRFHELLVLSVYIVLSHAFISKADIGFNAKSDPFVELVLRDARSGTEIPCTDTAAKGKSLKKRKKGAQQGKVRAKTKTVKKTLSPTWNESFTFPLPPTLNLTSVDNLRLSCVVWDEDFASSNDFLGEIHVTGGDIATFIGKGENMKSNKQPFTLKQQENKKNKSKVKVKVKGTLMLSFESNLGLILQKEGGERHDLANTSINDREAEVTSKIQSILKKKTLSGAEAEQVEALMRSLKESDGVNVTGSNISSAPAGAAIATPVEPLHVDTDATHDGITIGTVAKDNIDGIDGIPSSASGTTMDIAGTSSIPPHALSLRSASEKPIAPAKLPSQAPSNRRPDSDSDSVKMRQSRQRGVPHLRMIVKRATGLKSSDIDLKADPFVLVTFVDRDGKGITPRDRSQVT